MIPEILLSECGKGKEHLVVAIDHDVWLKDPVATSFVYLAFSSRSHTVIFVASGKKDDYELKCPYLTYYSGEENKKKYLLRMLQTGFLVR